MDVLRVVLVVVGALVLLLVGGFVGLVAGGPDRPGRELAFFEGEEFGFSYPGGWERIRGVEFPLAEATGQEQVGDSVFGIDRENWVSVFRAPPLGEAVVAGNIDQFVDYLDGFWLKLVRGVPSAELVLAPRRLSRAGCRAMSCG